MRVTEDLDRTTKDHSHLLREMKTVKDFVNARLKPVQDSEESAIPATSRAMSKSISVSSKQTLTGYFQKSRTSGPFQPFPTVSNTIGKFPSTSRVSHHFSDKFRLFSNERN